MTETESTRFLLDSNLLIYIYDKENTAKQQRALTLVDELLSEGRAALSVQCLSEFYRVVTTKLAPKMVPAEAYERIQYYSQHCEVFDITKEVLLEGSRGAVLYQRSIWDALIWAIAKLNGIPYIITEDARHDHRLDTVHYLNPFTHAFSIEDYLG